ncbi:MAG: CDP-glycerol glycerophosphotransferase family protein [Vicinamibacterales bacterium]
MTFVNSLRRLDATITRRSGARQVLVDSRTPLNYEMVAPVVRAMAADARVRFAFTASEEPARLGAIYRHAPADTRRIHPSRAALCRWDAYLTSDFMWATLPRGTARIQMFHGVAGKYGFDAPTTSMRSWDRLFFVNERRLRNFVAAGAIDAGSDALRLIGMPKVDCLVDGSLRRETVRREFGLDPSRPTVLYAPTWSPASSLNLLGEALIARLRRLPVNLIVKLHDRSLDPRPQYSGGIDWAARVGSNLAKAPNIAPLLVAADVMISDHSSAAFEFLILDRPLVRIEVPALLQQANVHPDYAALLASAADNTRDVDATVAAVERALASPGAGSAARRRVAADLFHRPGSATARCAAALYEVLELEPHPSFAAHGTGAAACVLST